jgi:aarF domain-containing kinase
VTHGPIPLTRSSSLRRFAPQQRTDYVALFNEWAVGFYTELDFKNEGANMDKMRELLDAQGVRDVLIPAVYPQYTSRRVLVTEWVDGVKLSECTPDQVKDLLEVGQEVFLTQLLQVGFFHSDPHPGNLMRPHDQSKGKLALIDFGLVAQVEQEDMDGIISSIVHLANKDYAALVDDFIALKILPADTNRVKVVPLMDKALTPYVKGGGAKRYEQELKSMYGFEETGAVGGFQQMTQDMLTVLNDIPFSIPPYFALIARAVVTLEGLALQSDPDYGLVLEAYPFVARKLLSEDRPEVQRALQQVLYSGGEMNGVVTPTRLAALVNNAAGIVARQEGAAFVDLDAVPADGISVTDAIAFVLSPQAASLRALLETEAITAADLLLRQALRKSVVAAAAALPQPPTLPFLPAPPNPWTLPAPFVIPPSGGRPARPLIVSTEELVENLAPKLTREEELYAISLTDLVKSTLGPDAAAVVSGELVTSPLSALRLLLAALAAAPAGGDAAAPAGADSGVSVPPAVAQAARQLADALPGGGGAALAAADFAASSDGTATMSVDDLAAAVGELGADERAALDESAGRVAEELQRRLNERVEAL